MEINDEATKLPFFEHWTEDSLEDGIPGDLADRVMAGNVDQHYEFLSPEDNLGHFMDRVANVVVFSDEFEFDDVQWFPSELVARAWFNVEVARMQAIVE